MTRPQAISKNEAISQLSTEVENWLAGAIPTLNSKLNNFTSGSYRTIYASVVGLNRLSGDAQKRAVEEIKKIYASQGWKVSYDSGDQRDPEPWFTFS